MAYAAIAAILTLAAGVPLGGALIVGVIGVPAVAALLAVLSVGVGGRTIPIPAAHAPTMLAPTPPSAPAAVTALPAVGTTTAGLMAEETAGVGEETVVVVERTGRRRLAFVAGHRSS